MTCKQLGGACGLAFQAETFDEIADLSKTHGQAMLDKGDEAHMKAMQAMRILSQTPGAMAAWMAQKRKQFEDLPEDEV